MRKKDIYNGETIEQSCGIIYIDEFAPMFPQ